MKSLLALFLTLSLGFCAAQTPVFLAVPPAGVGFITADVFVNKALIMTYDAAAAALWYPSY
jgi:hypothetical protein